jgi:hypothetical protein
MTSTAPVDPEQLYMNRSEPNGDYRMEMLCSDQYGGT